MAEEVCWVTPAKMTSKKLEGSGEKSRSDKGKGWCRAFALYETVSLTPKHTGTGKVFIWVSSFYPLV